MEILGSLLTYCDTAVKFLVLPAALAYIFFGLDDLLLDIYAWMKGLSPQKINTLDIEALREKPQKKLAIIVAAWKEYEVIARMIRGNMARIDYEEHSFYVGVYPNDTKTVAAVTELEREFKNVHMVVNTLDGPTSKGQMINQVVERILAQDAAGQPFDAIMIHDSEDLIHPASLLAVSEAMDRADFIQVPVYSLPVPAKELVGAVYMDEFAESHTKDLRVREAFTGSFPAAGVGMVISKSLLLKYWNASGNRLFNDASLTEDYEMGLKASAFNARSHFLYARTGPGYNDIIATREYFPKKVLSSVKQKSRWTVGIVFQGWMNLGWSGAWREKYFLYRDRKGPIANITVIIGLAIFLYSLARFAGGLTPTDLFKGSIAPYLFIMTNLMMVNRIFQRINATAFLYGWEASLLVPVRIVVGNLVNTGATLRAIKQFVGSQISGRAVKWAKTDHELPPEFGLQPGASIGGSVSSTGTASITSTSGLASIALALALGLVSAATPAQAFNDGPDVARTTGPCVRIYFDESNNPSYKLGPVYATFLRNILAHFSQYQQIVEPIENYEKGQIEECKATFYLGSYFENGIPQAFFEDYVTTKKNVVWMGYSIWKLGPERLQQALGAKFLRLTTLDKEKVDKKGRPTFFKEIGYKGEIFWKYGEFKVGDPSTFLAPFEMVGLDVVDPLKATVLSEARHNGTGEILPYIIRSENRFFVADIPFSFMHEADRYLIFTDLLFDILDEKPQHSKKRPAVFRLEDIYARVPQHQVYDIADTVHKLKVPLHIALIPIFHDPLAQVERKPEDTFLLMHQDPYFMQMLNEFKERHTRFIWHGVTHQYKSMRNPHTASSGDDFEFWDAINNRPVPDDSHSYVLNRLDDGFYTLEKAGIRPMIWEVPHYQASALDYMIFGRVFSWNIGRVIYSPFEQLTKAPAHEPSLWYETAGLSKSKERLQTFADLRVNTLPGPNGQMFPFEIYGDVYGQRVLPENLGNPQPFENSHVSSPRTIDEILDAARRNMKLRDVWGSLFFHPQLVDPLQREGVGMYPGDTTELTRLITEMRKMGYEFIDLEDFIKTRKSQMRPPAIVKQRKVNQ